MTATLIQNLTGKEIKVRATTSNPTSSYGYPVWVDSDNNAYLQVGIEWMQTLYSIKDIDDLEEYNKYYIKPNR